MRAGPIVVALALGALAVAGCSSESAAPPTPTPSAQESNPYGGLPVDPPGPQEVVLTVTGPTVVDLTMGELEKRAVTTVTLFEPFVLAEQSFDVIPLADLLAEAGIEPDAPVTTVALNDYRYSDTAAALSEAGALLAVTRDGAPIPMDQGGPIRIVFADSSPYAERLDAWNWSLREIVVDGPPGE